MADLRATLVTPGVNSNAALSAATDAFSNLQKQMNAPFDRKLEADIRDQNRQDKLNEVNYQHGRDSILDQREKDRIALEQRRYDEGKAKEAAQSAYLLAKTDPNKYGSDLAQKEYNAATNVEGLSDQDKADIHSALGTNYVKDRSSQIVNDAVNNSLVSGDTVYKLNKDVEDRKVDREKMQAEAEYRKKSLANDATRIQMEKDKVARENAKESTQAGAYGVNNNSTVDQATGLNVTTSEKNTGRRYISDGTKIGQDVYDKFNNDLSEQTKNDYLELQKAQDDKKMQLASKDDQINKNKFIKDFNSQRVDNKNNSVSVSKDYIDAQNNAVESDKNLKLLNTQLKNASSDEEKKNLQDQIAAETKKGLDFKGKYDLDSYIASRNLDIKNADERIAKHESNISKTTADLSNKFLNQYGDANETVKSNRIMTPQEAGERRYSEIVNSMSNDPRYKGVSKDVIAIAAAKEADKVKAEQKQIIDKQKESNQEIKKIVTGKTIDQVSDLYKDATSRLDKLEALQNGNINSSNGLLKWNSSNFKNQQEQLREEISKQKELVNGLLIRLGNYN